MTINHWIAIVAGCILIAAISEARIKPYTGSKTSDNPEYSDMYLANGSQATPESAFMSAIKGEKVYHCVLQEASMGKTGKSASLKNVKKKM